VGDHVLARLERLALAVNGDGHLVGLEGDEIVDPIDLAAGIVIGPRGPAGPADVVVVAQPLVRAEGLAIGKYATG
jgi:hypothetical protein